LLLHGFGDTPQTLYYLARHLHDAGFTVSAPLYPGHGATVAEFTGSFADQWIASARDALASLRARCGSVAVAGLSMGAAIGAILAAEDSSIDCLVLISPYLRPPLWVRAALKIKWIWAPLVGTIEATHPRSIQDPEERKKSLAYGVVNATAMAQLARVARAARAALPRVKLPTMVIQSRNDPRVKPEVAKMVMKNLGATEKRMVWANEGGHVITVDFGREQVIAEASSWISRWSGQPHRSATAPKA